MLHRPRRDRASPLAFGQLLRIDGAGLVLVEAVLERVLQMTEPEILRAACVQPVEERAVVAHVAHVSPLRKKEKSRRSPWGDIGKPFKAPVILS
jgi:hypothetical protein